MKQLGKYEILEELGKGGFGIVYQARDLHLGRLIALKVLHPQLTVEANFVDRFRREACALAQVNHPNVVTIYEIGEEAGRIYIAMEYLPGGSLADRTNLGLLSLEDALRIMKSVGEGLQAGHDEGVIHRDVKPGNILFNKQGEAVIADFGIAKAMEVSSSTFASSSGSAVGTPNYRPPELWLGSPPPSPATDIYSLACVFYEMLSGRKLFDGKTPPVVMQKHFNRQDLKIKWPKNIDRQYQRILKKALKKEPNDRYGNVAEFISALQEVKPVQEPEAVKRKHMPIWLQWTGAVALGIGLLLAGWFGKPRLNAHSPVTTRVNPNDLAVMVYVPEGNFSMGSNSKNAINREKPEHSVFLESYYIYQHEVTNAQFARFTESTGYQTDAEKQGSSDVIVGNAWKEMRGAYWAAPEGSGSNIVGRGSHPVVHVSWNDAQAYCQWAGARLPSEAEWEKAARGTDRRKYPWGNASPSCEKANFSGCVGGTTPVGSYPLGASPYGALDMAGNVFEWVSDWYREDYYQFSDIQNPIGPGEGSERVYRGGAWSSVTDNLRVINRPKAYPDYSMSRYGFRCAMSAGIQP